MDKRKKLSKKEKHVLRVVVLAFTGMCILISVLCFQYYMRLQDTIRDENSGYMQEISKQMGTNISKSMNDNYAVLEAIGTVLQSSETSGFKQFKEVTHGQQEYWKYSDIFLIDESGIAYDKDGNTVVLQGEDYLREAVVAKKPAMSVSQVVKEKDCVIFAVPIEPLVMEGNSMVALAATYDSQTFDKMLSMKAFDGKGYAHVVRQDGTVVIRSSVERAADTGYNILNFLSEAELKGKGTLEGVKADIAHRKSGQLEYVTKNAHEYMTYTPLHTQDWYLLTFVPVETVNAKSSLMLKITILLCSFVTLTFALLFVGWAVTVYRSHRKLEHIVYVDAVTGGNTEQRFYELAKGLLKAFGKSEYALIYTNIEKFKVLNEQFGEENCDDILRGIAYGIGENLNEGECMGRQLADHFYVLVKYTDEKTLTARLDTWYETYTTYMEQNGSTWLPLIMEFGIYIVEDALLPLPQMIDRAKLALTETAHELRGKLRYAIYDEQLRLTLFREKQIEDMMEQALENEEFQVYLQPKVLTNSEKIGGAEALVRWVSHTEGMIYPDEFITLFEKNGFIIQLDMWVFEKVCKTIRSWLDQGIRPVKISVNCSRAHLKNTKFIEQYAAIAKQYHTPSEFIEIELTETTVFEDVEYLIHTIEKIHEAGFGCSMDDFGSGYSSLNMIQDIPVDTIKIDRIFFRNSERDMERTKSVIGSIISMAKALSMLTVAEGVEQSSQVEMLKQLQCDYIQGYYFAKPMPILEFEKKYFGK
ncbi:MAG: GGDEF domain-containing protein [Lachnospiraceae bacterium]